MDCAIYIHFLFQVAVDISIGAHAVDTLRLDVLHIDLTCDALIAVFHARRALAHLNALHPWSGYITQRIRQTRPSQVGHILGEHLHIGAAQPQQLYLSSTGCRVTIGNIYRRIGSERLAKIAASGTLQLALPDYLRIHHLQA